MKRAIQMLVLATSLPLTAQTLTWEFEVEVKTWAVNWEHIFEDAVFKGRIDLDRSELVGTGQEMLSYSNTDPDFMIQLNLDGKIYDGDDDAAFGLPALHFQDGDLTGIDYAVTLDEPQYDYGAFLQIHPDGLMNYSPDGVGEYEGLVRITPTTVPEPSITCLFLIAGGLTLTYRKR